MAESNDAVSLDMEKIYLGGKVRALLQRLIFFLLSVLIFVVSFFFCFGIWSSSWKLKLIWDEVFWHWVQRLSLIFRNFEFFTVLIFLLSCLFSWEPWFAIRFAAFEMLELSPVWLHRKYRKRDRKVTFCILDACSSPSPSPL